MEERALTGIELFDKLATYHDREVKVSFAGLHIPVTGVRFYAAGEEIVLDVGSEWLWSELPKDEEHQRRPNPDPGEP
jgi:hypothetical protein